MREITTALNDISKAYNGFKQTKEKMYDQLQKDTAKLAPKYQQEETEKYKTTISNLRISYRRTIDAIMAGAAKAVGESLPSCLRPGQATVLENDRFLHYTAAEWSKLANEALKEKDLVFLRAIGNVAKDSGFKLEGLPMSGASAMENVSRVAKIASKLSEDNLEDRSTLEWGMRELIEQTTDDLSLFDESGDLKTIKAVPVTEDPFLKGFNHDMGNGAGGGNNG